MRIFLIPLFKLIGAIFMTLTVGIVDTLFGFLAFILHIFWRFKVPKENFWEYESNWIDIFAGSSYNIRLDNDYTTYYYKSTLHFIWGAKPTKNSNNLKNQIK